MPDAMGGAGGKLNQDEIDALIKSMLGASIVSEEEESETQKDK